MLPQPLLIGISRLRIIAACAIVLLFAMMTVRGQVAYTDVDTMKESRDRDANGTLSQAEINQIVALCATPNATHITIDAFYEYPSVIQQWVTAIRATGKGIHWRCQPNQWEDNNGTTGIMSTTNYLIAMTAFITNNPGFFASGDIFEPVTEPEDAPYWNNKYGANFSWPGAPATEYNNFVINAGATADAAFSAIGVTGVITYIRSMNGWIAQNVLSSAAVSSMNNHVAIDTYPEGTNTDPATCASLRVADYVNTHNVWPNALICVGEMGYCNDASASDTVQSNVLVAEFTAMQALPYMGGVNYWVGPGASGDGGYTYVMEESGGTWVPRPGYFAVSNYFGNVLVPAAPQSLSATLVASNQVDLNWQSNTAPNLSGYNIYRSTNNGFMPGAGSLIATNVPTNAWTDMVVFPPPAYYYRVTARSYVGLQSVPSSQVSVGSTNAIIQIQPSGGALILSWPLGALLEATNITGPWTTNFAATSPYTVLPTNPQQFFQLQLNAVPPALNPISVDFSGTGGFGTNMASTEIAGEMTVSNWNNAVGLSGSNQSLVDSSGASSTATLTWDDPKSFANNGSIPNNSGNDRMMKFYLDSSSTTVTTITVTNLPSDPNGFQVLVYCDGSNSETREGAYTISGTGITTTAIDAFDNANINFSGAFTQASNSAGNYVVFTIGNVGGFTLTATAVNNGAQFPRGPLNGFQIFPQ